MNEVIAGIVVDGVLVHEDYAPVRGCRMGDLTYGEVCIKCNVCGRFGEPRTLESEVRGRIGDHTVTVDVDEGWAFSGDVRHMHYYERHNSASLCGTVGKCDELCEVDEDTIERFKHQFCTMCLEEKSEKG